MILNFYVANKLLNFYLLTSQRSELVVSWGVCSFFFIILLVPMHTAEIDHVKKINNLCLDKQDYW